MIGPANPAYKDGRYSKLLTGDFGQHYADAEADVRLMSLRSNIAMVETHIRDVYAMVTRGELDPIVAWEKLEGMFEQRRKLTDTEAKTIGMVHKMVTADQVRAFAAQVVNILHRHEKDRDILQAIARDIRALQVAGQDVRGMSDE